MHYFMISQQKEQINSLIANFKWPILHIKPLLQDNSSNDFFIYYELNKLSVLKLKEHLYKNG